MAQLINQPARSSSTKRVKIGGDFKGGLNLRESRSAIKNNEVALLDNVVITDEGNLVRRPGVINYQTGQHVSTADGSLIDLIDLATRSDTKPSTNNYFEYEDSDNVLKQVFIVGGFLFEKRFDEEHYKIQDVWVPNKDPAKPMLNKFPVFNIYDYNKTRFKDYHAINLDHMSDPVRFRDELFLPMGSNTLVRSKVRFKSPTSDEIELDKDGIPFKQGESSSRLISVTKDYTAVDVDFTNNEVLTTSPLKTTKDIDLTEGGAVAVDFGQTIKFGGKYQVEYNANTLTGLTYTAPIIVDSISFGKFGFGEGMKVNGASSPNLLIDPRNNTDGRWAEAKTIIEKGGVVRMNVYFRYIYRSGFGQYDKGYGVYQLDAATTKQLVMQEKTVGSAFALALVVIDREDPRDSSKTLARFSLVTREYATDVISGEITPNSTNSFYGGRELIRWFPNVQILSADITPSAADTALFPILRDLSPHVQQVINSAPNADQEYLYMDFEIENASVQGKFPIGEFDFFSAPFPSTSGSINSSINKAGVVLDTSEGIIPGSTVTMSLKVKPDGLTKITENIELTLNSAIAQFFRTNSAGTLRIHNTPVISSVHREILTADANYKYAWFMMTPSKISSSDLHSKGQNLFHLANDKASIGFAPSISAALPAFSSPTNKPNTTAYAVTDFYLTKSPIAYNDRTNEYLLTINYPGGSTDQKWGYKLLNIEEYKSAIAAGKNFDEPDTNVVMSDYLTTADNIANIFLLGDKEYIVYIYGTATVSGVKKTISRSFKIVPVTFQREEVDVWRTVREFGHCFKSIKYKDRLIMYNGMSNEEISKFGNSISGNLLFYSDYNNPFYFPYTSIIEINTPLNEPIISVTPWNNTLVVSTENYKVYLTGDSFDKMTKKIISSQVGIISQRSEVSQGSGLIGLTKTGVQTLTQLYGSNDAFKFKQTDAMLADLLSVPDTKAAAINLDGDYYISFPNRPQEFKNTESGGTSLKYVILVYYGDLGAWTKWSSPYFDIIKFFIKDKELYGVRKNKAQVIKLDKKVYDDIGESIPVVVKTKAYDLDFPHNIKKFKEIRLGVKTTSSDPLEVLTRVEADGNIIKDWELFEAVVHSDGSAFSTRVPNPTEFKTKLVSGRDALTYGNKISTTNQIVTFQTQAKSVIIGIEIIHEQKTYFLLENISIEFKLKKPIKNRGRTTR